MGVAGWGRGGVGGVGGGGGGVKSGPGWGGKGDGMGRYFLGSVAKGKVL